MTVVLMAVAGGLGAGGRYALDTWMRRRIPMRLPWPTMLINTTGSFALGLLLGLGVGGTWSTVVGTGLLGGYTTFSTASVNTAQLVLDRRYAAAAVNALGMLVLGVAAAACGYVLGG